jgi:hypothetical protein
MSANAAQKPELESSLLKTVFIYNFAKFTRWPNSHSITMQNAISICSIGDDKLAKKLQKLNGKVVQGKPIKTVQITDELAIGNCHVLYLANSKKEQSADLLNSIKTKPILTISEINRFSEIGGMIELTQDRDKLRFIINLNSTRSSGLKLSARLLDLATVIDTEAQ